MFYVVGFGPARPAFGEDTPASEADRNFIVAAAQVEMNVTRPARPDDRQQQTVDRLAELDRGETVPSKPISLVPRRMGTRLAQRSTTNV
jgi:hypothetical protein